MMDLSPLQNKPVIFLFSAGKDAIVAGDIFRKQYNGPVTWVYLYFVKGLSFVDSIIRHYEQRWGITIEQRPCHETLSIIAQRDQRNRRKHWTPGMVEDGLKKEFGCEWFVDGVKRNDSLARRGMFKDVKGPIDYKYGKVHPLIDWTDAMVRSYLKINRLPVPVTYQMGRKRSLWIITQRMLALLQENFPSDYELVVSEIPELQDALFRKERR